MGALSLRLTTLRFFPFLLLVGLCLSGCSAYSPFPTETESSEMEIENEAAFTLLPLEGDPVNKVVIQVNLEQFWVHSVTAQELTDEVASNLSVTLDDKEIEDISISYINVLGGAITDENGEVVGSYGSPLTISFETEELIRGNHEIAIKSRAPSGVYQYFVWNITCDRGCELVDD